MPSKTIVNDVPALLKARFQTNDPAVIEPLVAMGWNAATTVTVVRDATLFDENERVDEPMWRLAVQVGAWEVLNAWLKAPHPHPQAWAREITGAAQNAWYEGQYPLAEALTRWLQSADPDGHEARLRQALLAMSEHAPRSLSPAAGVTRLQTQDGLQRWHALGGQWGWALNERGPARHPMDLTVASPAVRWLYGLDLNALRTLDDHQVAWMPVAMAHAGRAFVQWAQALLSVRDPDPQHPQVNTIMEDGLNLFIDLVKRAPMETVLELGTSIPELASQCREQRSWAGRGEAWAQALAVAYEARVLGREVDETPLAKTPGRDRQRL